MSDEGLELDAQIVVLQSLEDAMETMWKVKTWLVGVNNGLEFGSVTSGQYTQHSGFNFVNEVKDLACAFGTALLVGQIPKWPYALAQASNEYGWIGRGASLICLGLVENPSKEIIGTAWRGSLSWDLTDRDTGEVLVEFPYILASGTSNGGSLSFEFFPADGDQDPYILTLTPSSYWNFS